MDWSHYFAYSYHLRIENYGNGPRCFEPSLIKRFSSETLAQRTQAALDSDCRCPLREMNRLGSGTT